MHHGIDRSPPPAHQAWAPTPSPSCYSHLVAINGNLFNLRTVHLRTVSPFPRVLTSTGGHQNMLRLTSGRYASYWNAFMFVILLIHYSRPLLTYTSGFRIADWFYVSGSSSEVLTDWRYHSICHKILPFGKPLLGYWKRFCLYKDPRLNKMSKITFDLYVVYYRYRHLPRHVKCLQTG